MNSFKILHIQMKACGLLSLDHMFSLISVLVVKPRTKNIGAPDFRIASPQGTVL